MTIRLSRMLSGLPASALCCSLFLALFSLSALPQQTQAAPAAALPASGPLSAQEGLALIKQMGPALHILDVRSEEEFTNGHISGAQLLPVQELSRRLSEVPTDKPILIVCRTGRRAQAAYEYIHKARPQQEQLWYLRAAPEYQADGTYTFR